MHKIFSCSAIFSRFAAKIRQNFSAVFPFFSDIDALLLKYSNFTPSDSCINPFVSNTHFLYLLKTLENRKVCKISRGFQGVEKGCIGTKWVNQQLLLPHELCNALDDSYEVKFIFCDISKTFHSSIFNFWKDLTTK